MDLKRILIVEDEAIVAKDIELRLKEMGYEVTGMASTGDKALAILATSPTDLVLMDINLKGKMDGIDTAILVRKTHDIPVVFLTAYADGPTFERAKLTDPFGYILKPFEERALQIHIEIAFHKYQVEKRIKSREKWIESVLNSINSAVIATDIAGKITYINPSAEAFLNIQSTQLLEQSVLDSIQFQDDSGHPMLTHPIQLVLRKGTPQLFDQIGLRVQDNPPKTVQLSITGLRDHGDQLIGSVMGLSDISRRREIERDLRIAQQSLSSRIEKSSKSLRKKLEHTQLQLTINHQTIKQLRKIERRYTHLVGGAGADE
jgi:PAS domain S-box-containing protein